MTDSIAIDVVIGLVFIYTLYSLLTTTIVELVSTYFQLRARNLASGIQRMLDDDSQTIFSKKFYATPLIKYMASGRWRIFNKPSYLQPRNFSTALIQLLKEESETGATTLEKVADALEGYRDTSTGKFLLDQLEEANNDLEKFKASLETWFDDTMQRASGWYKSRITLITFLVGLAVATVFNVDTFDIAGKLSRDPKAREQYLQLAVQLSSDSILFNTPAVRDSLVKTLDSMRLYSAQSIDILGSKRKTGLKGGSAFVATIWYSSLHNFFGCLLTALALALGAPFWFDLLNKIMRLRGSISKPTIAEDAAKK